MSGQNVSLLDLPPGIFQDSTQYAVGKKWYSANQVRWVNNVMIPVGGWRQLLDFGGISTTSIRKLFTWRDDLKAPWLAAGSEDKLIGASYINGVFTQYDITPASLAWNPGGVVGFGRRGFGSGPFGIDGGGSSVVFDQTALWSLDNFGKLLVGVHSQDGRLVSWDPLTPATVSTAVTGAPIDNTLVLATEEEHLMLLGGKNNPRRVQWCSRREINTWVATEDNSAGGWDLKSNGAIVAACKVQSGILVVTDSDVHLIEYVGPPEYYGRRKISDEGGVIGSNTLVAVRGDAIWMDHANLFSYSGGAIEKVPCTLHTELFYNSNLTASHKVHMGLNEFAQELWLFYPNRDSSDPDRYVALSYSKDSYWTQGQMPRTAWIHPVWQPRPLGCNGTILYEQEYGSLADGESRSSEIYAETGALEIGEGDTSMWVDRIYQDAGAEGPGFSIGDPDAFTLTFKLQQAPGAPERLVGPIRLANPKGYTTVRMKARQAVVRVSQNKDVVWKLGKVRLRIKQAGRR
ncbi:MAG: hypothetical protein EHM33_00360 [Chloroflexi bacterium]|nr:MAG: hypothetical protein EHM33_00360 [Chloroflexota bacterium]